MKYLMNWMFGVFVEPFPKIFENESFNLFNDKKSRELEGIFFSFWIV